MPETAVRNYKPAGPGKPLTVLFLIESSGVGGSERIVVDLCDGLEKNKFRPIACLLRDGWLRRQLDSKGIQSWIIENRHSYDPFLIARLVKIIRENNVGIVHSHEFFMNIYGSAAAFLTGVPNVATIHGRNYYTDRWIRRAAYRWISFRKKTRLVAVSNSLKEFVSSRLKIRPQRIAVVYNGVDKSKFDDNDLLHKNNDKKNGAPVIGTVGNVYPVKGHIYLIKAASRILKEFPAATFLIIGSITPYLEELKIEMEKNGVSKSFRFAGFTESEDIPALLRTMDIFVLPSVQESFSLATAEAMLCSRPVVVTRSGGPEELVNNGINGFLVPPCDPGELAAKILALLKNKALMESFGKRAKINIMDNFTLEEMNLRYQRLYENLRQNI